MTAVTVRAVDAAGLTEYVEQSLTVYGAAMGRPPSELPARRLILRRHLGYAGLTGQVAVTQPNRLVGFSYGYRGTAGQWWHDLITAPLQSLDDGRWLNDPFEVAELHVLPEFQGAGLGRRLLTRLLTTVAAPVVLLSTPDAPTPARRLYRSMGFQELVTGFVFPGTPERYVVMGRPLPLDVTCEVPDA